MAEFAQPEPAGDVAIEIDDDDNNDNDSAYGEGVSTGTLSLKTSALRYEWKHGRRYHSYHSGSYNFPNDEREQDRLDLIHHVFFRAAGDRLFLAPVDPDRGLRVLDLGTGTGIWPIHMGDMYPGAELIVGNDLSPIQPQWVPPNVKFVVDDVEADWHDTEIYDYIHCRYMSGSVRDWPRMVRQMYEHLRPGGWVEFQETANMPYPEEQERGEAADPTAGGKIVELMEWLVIACDRIGRTIDPAPSMKGWVEAAGFGNVTEHKFKVPLGTWPKDSRLKEIGTLMRYNFIEGVDAFTAALFREVLGWSDEQIEELNAGVEADARRRDSHLVFDYLVLTAQKPI
ncbi:Methyltransferase domain-containing protein [Pleurostoma richardsiae]|uniref:Methyltransferase domain-containing protein n=1 Tax=Pleurostoma richardsiae TaxID=41990 RepID=A0AA38VBE1_9PEZI|nr:Methyltransferase domain-containing protein [Pleurostoma richardsiae]